MTLANPTLISSRNEVSDVVSSPIALVLASIDVLMSLISVSVAGVMVHVAMGMDLGLLDFLSSINIFLTVVLTASAE